MKYLITFVALLEIEKKFDIIKTQIDELKHDVQRIREATQMVHFDVPDMTLADGFMDMDLNSRLITNPPASYLFPSQEDGIEQIEKNSLLVVDRSITPKPGHILIVNLDGEIAIRRLIRDRGRLALITDKGYTAPHYVSEDGFYSKGVVKAAIHLLV